MVEQRSVSMSSMAPNRVPEKWELLGSSDRVVGHTGATLGRLPGLNAYRALKQFREHLGL